LSSQPVQPKKSRLDPVLWSCLMLVLGFFLLFTYLAPKVAEYVETNQIPLEQMQIQIAPILIYFFSAVVILGIVLFIIPVRFLKYVMQVVFAVLYAWGIVIICGLVLPGWPSVAIGAVVAIIWLFRPILWLQNILLLLTLTAVGAVFGVLISPWTVVWVLVALSIYDVVAVRLGYMMWMARKLSESDTLPAFILPRQNKLWGSNLKSSGMQQIFTSEASEREFSLLGGGDLGFPLIFTASVYSAYGFQGAFIVAIACLLGLLLAYALQIWWLKGKPLPALPPISFVAIIGFLIVRYWM
jgi:presenilin-like A22 family membrane protease